MHIKTFLRWCRRRRRYHIYLTMLLGFSTIILSAREITRLEQIRDSGDVSPLAPRENDQNDPASAENNTDHKNQRQWIDRKLNANEEFSGPLGDSRNRPVMKVARQNSPVTNSIKLLSNTENKSQPIKTLKSVVWFNVPSWVRHWSGVKMFGHCRVNQCDISYDRGDLHKANAVLVNGFTLEEDPPIRTLSQIFILFALEPSSYLNIPPSWGNFFNWTLSYRSDSDIWRPYGQVRKFRSRGETQDYKKIMQRKNKAVAWFVSRCVSHSRREDYVEQLSKHVDVDVFGRCTPNHCEPEDCYLMLKSYRFFLAFENTFCDEYVTEKFFKTLLHDVIPVVRGGANYSGHFGDGYIINTGNFADVSQLGSYLSSLMKDDDAYVKMLRQKHAYQATFPLPWCDLCSRLHAPVTESVYPNIQQWLDKEHCHLPNDMK